MTPPLRKYWIYGNQKETFDAVYTATGKFYYFKTDVCNIMLLPDLLTIHYPGFIGENPESIQSLNLQNTVKSDRFAIDDRCLFTLEQIKKLASLAPSEKRFKFVNFLTILEKPLMLQDFELRDIQVTPNYNSKSVNTKITADVTSVDNGICALPNAVTNEPSAGTEESELSIVGVNNPKKKIIDEITISDDDNNDEDGNNNNNNDKDDEDSDVESYRLCRRKNRDRIVNRLLSINKNDTQKNKLYRKFLKLAIRRVAKGKKLECVILH